MLKRLFSALLTLVLISVYFSQATHAESAPTTAQPAIVITEFSSTSGFFELYNQSAQPVYVGNMKINFTIKGAVANQEIVEDVSVALPDGWLLSKQYLMLQKGSGADPGIVYYNFESVLTSSSVTKVSLVSDAIEQYVVSLPTSVASIQYIQHRQRSNATIKLTGVFASDYTIVALPAAKYPSMVYSPPLTSGGLEVVEILPNARDCPSYDGSLDCGDYVKLYNPTDSAIDTSLYRLRTSSGGSKSSTANTFTLTGLLQPGEYMLVYQKDNGGAIAVTNTGGNIWLEDKYGITAYPDTSVVYPDASSTKIKGSSWAFDETDATWKWMQPRPSADNYWPPQTTNQEQSGDAVINTQSCAPGKERNPETNRCRNIVTASVATSCKVGQERNASTGRCRSVLVSNTGQKACNADQYRNPDTGRCKKLAAISTPAPCKANQERNPETNRCRKKVIKGKEVSEVQDVRSDSKTRSSGWTFAGIGMLVITGYGIYEWRQDIVARLSSLKTMSRIRWRK